MAGLDPPSAGMTAESHCVIRVALSPLHVMAALVAAIHDCAAPADCKDVDARAERGHDG